MSEYLLQSTQSIDLSISHSAQPTVEQDDKALVAASQAGDQDAFAALVQRHQRRVFNLVFRMLQNYDEANEVTQDAFFAAWQGLSSFRGDAQFSTWLYRVAYNCALKQLDQRRRDGVLQSAIQTDMSDTEEHIAACIETYDRQEIIRNQLLTLPTKYRIVLVLRHLQDMTYEEMAEILSVPIGTIKTHLFRARNLLKERLLAIEHEWKMRE
jgi:RNA polymerase sigma-70 factor, ECF subfamily